MASGYAFVTLLTTNSYLQGALALAAALRDVHAGTNTSFQTVCLVTPETVDVSTVKLLRRAFDVVIGVELISQQDAKGLKLLGRPDLDTVLTKLHVFRLTQYQKIIFLDADVLPIRPLSHLFTLPHDFSAVPDVGWPDIFNSGVLVLSPGQEKFDELTTLFHSRGSWDGGDQGLLNEWRGNDWNRLSFVYNTTPTAAYTYAPAYERFGSQISAIHFIGPNKPWQSVPSRPPFQQSSQSEALSGDHQVYDYTSLLDRWFAVYDRHYRSQDIVHDTGFQVKQYASVWEQGFPVSSGAIGLEELKQVAIEGTSTLFPQIGDGEYRSMPLEGRVDLMRRPPDQPSLTISEAAPIPLAERGSSPFLTHPMDLPPSPHVHPVPLPSVETPTQERPFLLAPHDQRYSSQTAHQDTSRPTQQSVHQDSVQPTQQYTSQSGQQDSFQPSYHPSPQPSHPQPLPPQTRSAVQQPTYHPSLPPAPPARPPSPPKVMWNPAIEPPPNVAPPPSAFPSDTYFPNVWDQPPSKFHDQPPQQRHHTSPSQPTESGAFFRPPPTPEIPEQLRQQGHYRNVTGDAAGATPSPDKKKVNPVFPWEEKPRQLPGRVFPDYDAPQRELFLSPVSPPTSPPSVTATISPSQTVSPPPRGLPLSLAYANAWDTVPSIQRYAERLVRPAVPPALAPAFDSEEWKKLHGGRSWDERSEANSRDGDDEDDGDDENRKWTEVSEEEEGHSPTSSGSSAKARSRRDSSSVSASYMTKGKKKEYRVRGVQTIPPDTRSIGVQVDLLNIDSSPSKVLDRRDPGSRFSRGNGMKKWVPTISPPAVGLVVSQGPELSMMTAAPSPTRPGTDGLPSTTPTGMRSPREYAFPVATPRALAAAAAIQQPQRVSPPSATISRQTSHDGSSLASPPSSYGPLSPPPAEGQFMSPNRKGGRVWDPARGVDLFKRGSEEVLARFLRMGSWEDENTHQP